ncbi:MAG: MG2 domain-containing protein [Salinivirgaceae bacterium]|nr:MG2 domain-containing protein [Salinivirgaceae bacterium]
MNKFFSLVMCICIAFSTFGQAKHHKQITHFETNNQIREALSLVDSLLPVAQKLQDYAEYSFLVIHRMKFISQIYDIDQNQIYDSLKVSIRKAPKASLPVMKLLEAFLITNYYQSNRWNIDKKLDDGIDNPLLEEKSSHDLVKRVIDCIDSAATLSNEFGHDLNTYKDFFVGTNTKFDQLIDQIYFQGISLISKFESDNYDIDQAQYHDIQMVKTPSSLVTTMLKWYSDWYKVHENSLEIQGFIELNRAEKLFQLNNSIERLAMYENHLIFLRKKFASEKVCADVEIELTKHYQLLARQHDFTDSTTTKYYPYLAKAETMANEIIGRYPKTIAEKEAQAILSNIHKPVFVVSAKSYAVADHNFAVSIGYNNVEKVIVRLRKVHGIAFWKNHEFEKFTKNPVLFEQEYLLPKANDFYTHSTQIVVPFGKSGTYLLETVPSGELEKQPIYQFINISGLTVFSEQTEKEFSNVRVVDRFNGSEIKSAKIELYSSNYNRRDRKSEFNKIGDYDVKNGLVQIPSDKLAKSRHVAVINGTDTLWQQIYLNFATHRDQNSRGRVELFTDRAIYRPGQTVYVKGISYRGANRSWNSVPNEKLKITVRDGNYTEISTFDVQTNEFGSFNLTFPIPQGSKPGQFSISTENGRTSVRVESYRRYTFDASFENPTKPVRPGEDVEILLKATTFSGVNLNQLSIKGEVSLTSPHIWWFPSSLKTIAVIDTTTDANGNLKIRFNTSKNILSQLFKINITVKTPAGESREFQHVYSVSNNPYIVKVDKSKIVKGLMQPKVSVEQVNGGTCAENITLKILKLTAPKQVLIGNESRNIDKPSYSLNEWRELMPFAEYSNELDIREMMVDKEIWNYSGSATDLILSEKMLNKLTEGIYRVQLNVNGALSKTHFTIVDTKSNGLAIPEILDIYTNTTKATINEEITIVFVSAVENAILHYGITAGDKTIEQKRLKLSKGKYQVVIPVLADYEGNIYINAVIAFGGNVVERNATIAVERWSKQLKIEALSMRSPLLPGIKEEWTFKITTPDNRPLNAELLALMYDQSLDEFTPKGSMQIPIWYPSVNTTSFRAPENARKTDYLMGQALPEVATEWLSWQFFGLTSLGSAHNFLNNMEYGDIQYQRKGARTMDMAVEQSLSPETEGVTEVAAETTQVGNNDNDTQIEVTDPTQTPPTLRTNFNETAFFYPALQHNEKGEVSFKFQVPDALTQWKLQLFGHDKTISTGYFEASVQTQKPLMIVPLFPRFAYTGDSLIIQVSVYNKTDSVLIITPKAEIFDYQTNAMLSILLSSNQLTLSPQKESLFSVAFKIPDKPGVLTARLFASAGEFTDGEENFIPVWPNRKYVTNALALWGKPNSTTEYKFDDMMPLNPTTESQHKITLDMSTNPTWYAIQSLPMFDNPHPRSPISLMEAVFAAQTGTYLIDKYPVIGKTIHQWRKYEPDALQAQLEKNPELKITEIEQTPWYNDALDEKAQKHKLALFLDKNTMDNLSENSIEMLGKLQHQSGGFSWIPDFRPSAYITMHIVELIGKMNKMNPNLTQSYPTLMEIAKNGLRFVEKEIERDYSEMLKAKQDTSKLMSPYHVVRYLYVKSLIEPSFQPQSKMEQYYWRHAKNHAQEYNLYGRAILGMVARTSGDVKLATRLFKGFDGSSVVHPQKGIFWRENTHGWEWYQSPIEIQIRILEFYNQMQAPTEKIEALKIWILQQKRTRQWNSNSATAQAVYALVTSGRNWIENQEPVTITLSNLKIVSTEYTQQSGTGYFKTTFEGDEIPNNLNFVAINNPNSNPVYGGLYAQFYEDFTNIKPWQQNVAISTEYFAYDQNGEELILTKVEESNLKQGSKIKARITVSTDRPMDYVVVQLPFATCFEPVDQMSRYAWESGEGYYIQNYDNRAEFFFYSMKQGNTVLEYDVYTIRPGEYQAAPATVQSLYAPEFGAHSKGMKFIVH